MKAKRGRTISQVQGHDSQSILGSAILEWSNVREKESTGERMGEGHGAGTEESRIGRVGEGV